MEYLFIGLGGALGALSRYGISKWVSHRWKKDFPLGTFIANITGAFLLGYLYILFSTENGIPESFEFLTTTGFLGALTTYSTFSYEIINLLEQDRVFIGITYLITSVIVGLLAAYAGMLATGLM